MTTSIEDLKTQRKAIDAEIAAERKKNAEQKRAERAERDRLESIRITELLDEEHAWHSDFAKGKYVLGADVSTSYLSNEPGAIFTVTEWGEHREEVVVSGADLIALRDYLNTIIG
jgi:hypothetical protein